MAPILYFVDTSPPVRAVMLTAAAIGLDIELKSVDLENGEHMQPDYAKINPQRTVPVLDDDGFVFWDSHAIAAYLVEKYAKDDSFYPKDLQKRAICDQRMHFDSGVLFPNMRAILYPIGFLGRKHIPTELEISMKQAYALCDAFLEGNKYFAGNQLTIADFCAIATLTTVIPTLPYDTAKYPNLTAWMNRMKSLPYYHENNGIGAEKVRIIVKKLLEKS